MKLTILIILLALSAPVLAADVYLCKSEHATGFSFNKKTKKWSSAKFETGIKYTIKKTGKKSPRWEVYKFGRKKPVMDCKNSFNKSGHLLCDNLAYDFKLSIDNLRFLHIYKLGYWSDDLEASKGLFQEGGDTPHMIIGRCEPLWD